MLYRNELANVPEIRPLADPQGYDFKHAWHLFVVRVDTPKIGRDAFMTELKARNIGTGLHFRCAHLQKYYREEMGFRPGMLPATEYNSDRICSLPLFPDMTLDDVIDVVDAIKSVLAEK
ncbi:UDP-4-amino-4-deoxy-L-arabinose--oxoglutarate aminotransferase [bioreactor metagenome]|uniref:UDP-4-amino-4-deoxy-L-arabinose--oxoglutarate aminotransferase n=1 Tax=bioreactor metagenome TaxID=1076179 RepID=A0A645FPM2_9ZZZZ